MFKAIFSGHNNISRGTKIWGALPWMPSMATGLRRGPWKSCCCFVKATGKQ